jgi:photosystem II PsbU protein
VIGILAVIDMIASFLIGVCFLIASWTGLGMVQPVAAQVLLNGSIPQTYILSDVRRNPVNEKLGEVRSKIDLNNSNVRTFRQYPGLYPTLARKIIDHAPFDDVKDVLDIPGLSDREIEILKSNLDHFVVTPTEPALTEGGDRINPGIYK